ncbi:hypothetical protein AV274_6411 [Blastocystis sp. ATCC 50177/Nand II]|uniref:Mediator of RNA polymerase II transcription subunit 10 n=1 Tax=Blastocystis sp. subtype 1 (strain ATCC 50177 / NandII) TaxID=478820 RepID=A0A196S760_BLAHN|nr:hypothetical protein AV274_6411 [Blastocystis sp. ATCC 50177/Nand II]
MSVISDADSNRIFLRSLEALHQRIIDLTSTLDSQDMKPNMKRAAEIINDIIRTLKGINDMQTPYNCLIPLSLLQWVDKKEDNNPDVYYNLCLKICAETDQAYKARRLTTKHIINRIQTDMAEFLT